MLPSPSQAAPPPPRELSGSQPAKQPDNPGFSEIFRQHSSLVWRVLSGMGLRPPQIEDAAQDVFLIVHNKLEQFEGRSKLSTWICGIAHRVGLNYRRKWKRQLESQPLEESEVAALGTPEDDASASQSARLVRRFCEQLEDGMRDVFVLCFLEERRPVEVAEILNLNQQTVYSRVRLLRHSFQKAMQDQKGQGKQ